MDFVVSKVLMSICALLVVSILGGMFGTDAILDRGSELESVAQEFCSLVDSCAVSRSEASVSWIVPFTASGGIVTFNLSSSIVRVWTEEGHAIDQPVCSIHTWRPIGGPLNSSELNSLDAGSPRIEAHSGDRLSIVSHLTLLDQSWKMLVFVGRDP